MINDHFVDNKTKSLEKHGLLSFNDNNWPQSIVWKIYFTKLNKTTIWDSFTFYVINFPFLN